MHGIPESPSPVRARLFRERSWTLLKVSRSFRIVRTILSACKEQGAGSSGHGGWTLQTAGLLFDRSQVRVN